MILDDALDIGKSFGFPHTCGGDPGAKDAGMDIGMLSPHMWGDSRDSTSFYHSRQLSPHVWG